MPAPAFKTCLVLLTFLPGIALAGVSLEQRWKAFSLDPGYPDASVRFPHASCFARAARKHDVPESLLLAVARGESGFDRYAVSEADAVGLMQIQWPGTARELGVYRRSKLYSPCLNVELGARYLSVLLARFDDNLHVALGAYNVGPTRVAWELDRYGRLPAAAARYSEYIYGHLEAVTSEPRDTSLAAGSARGDVVVTSFSRRHRAAAMVDHLSRVGTGLHFMVRQGGYPAKPRYEVVFSYKSGHDFTRGRRVLATYGFDVL